MFRIQPRRKALVAVASLVAALVIPLVAVAPVHAFVITRIADLPAGSRVAVADDFNSDHETDLAVASDCAIHVLSDTAMGPSTRPPPSRWAARRAATCALG